MSKVNKANKEGKRVLKSFEDLKEGMKVYIRDDLRSLVYYGGNSWVSSMAKGIVEFDDFESEDRVSFKTGRKYKDKYRYTNEMIDWDKTNELNYPEITQTPNAIRCIYTNAVNFTKGKIYALDENQWFVDDDGIKYTHKDVEFGDNIYYGSLDVRFEPVELVDKGDKGEVEMTKEEFFKKYKGENVAVLCDTKEKSDEFLRLAEKFGVKWGSGKKPTELNYYEEESGVYYTIWDDNELTHRNDFNHPVVKFEIFKAQPKQSNFVSLPQIKTINSEQDNNSIFGTFIQIDDKIIIYTEDNRVGVAYCHPDDEFNLEVGKALAYYRWVKGE